MADTDLFVQLEKELKRSSVSRESQRRGHDGPRVPKKQAGEKRVPVKKGAKRSQITPNSKSKRANNPALSALNTKAPNEQPVPQHHGQSTNQSTSQLTSKSIDQSTQQSTGQPASRPTSQLTGKVIDRPVAFYLPELVNRKIDEAVEYINRQHGVKVDRSAVVSALLGNPMIWENQELDRLVDKVIAQLTNRLTSRLVK